MRWTSLGSDLFCPIAVCRRPGEITLCARGATGELVYREWKSGGWREARSLGAPVARDNESGRTMPVEWPLAGCSGDATRIDLFARSPDGDLLHMTVRGDTWGTFERLGAPATTKSGGRRRPTTRPRAR